MEKHSGSEIREAIFKKFENDIYMKELGLEVLELRTGYIKSRIPVKKEHLNSYGFVHGGVLYGFADVSAGMAASMCGCHVVTAEGSMRYMEPGDNTEYIHCEAQALREGKHLLFYHVKLTTDDGTLIDDGTFSFFNTGKAITGV